ncbi:hypothetical protein HELRODRAFT_176894 [Helobdella robusta]|uniref:F5/8 type C domain-containing protein n=1 Tax=Helobdella robusta TaxID=6412 RepID=T1FB11_HELRO|nr:hypothetical protein HELRODRAFT_176894 [Helobdella robusta]ESN98427.1 hypothetical protein HELRODRAFT_176894 [Helobdella robusta]
MPKLTVLAKLFLITAALFNNIVSASDCMSKDGTYHGNLNVSASGQRCSPWLSTKPCSKGVSDVNATFTHNFCRNPVEPASCHHERPYCFLDSSNNLWEFCDMPICGSEPSTTCLNALGLGDGRIRDDQIYAPTQYDDSFKPSFARFNNSNTNAWRASVNYPRYVYLTVNLTAIYTITKLAIRSVSTASYYYVSTFKIMYSNDGFSWQFYGNGADDLAEAHEFEGNHGNSDISVVYFDTPIQAILLAIIPTSYSLLPTFQLELYGCLAPTIVSTKTEITQNINSNVFWSKSSSPYIIRSAILVGVGVTLTIEAGVKVIFVGNTASLTISACNNFAVRNLYVRGSGLTTNLKTISFSGLVVKNAPKAVSLTNYENVTFSNSLFKSNQIGIVALRSQLTIYACRFLNHEDAALKIDEYSDDTPLVLSISDSLFQNNFYGLYIHKSQTYSLPNDTLQIINTVFVNNKFRAIRIYNYNYVGVNFISFLIQNSTLSANLEIPFYLYINNNANITITQSKFINNYGTSALQIFLLPGTNFKSLLRIDSNVFSNNTMDETIALSAESPSEVTISNNQLVNFNTPYEIACHAPYIKGFGYNADLNYWATTDTRNISDRIFDMYKDSTRSFVRFSSILKNESRDSLLVLSDARALYKFNGTVGDLLNISVQSNFKFCTVCVRSSVNGNIVLSSLEAKGYNVTNTIFVTNGGCLTIQGPLQLKFKTATGIVVEGGCLKIDGNVTLTSSDKQWNGIKFLNSNGSMLKNIFVNASIWPLEIINSSVTVQTSTFDSQNFLKFSDQSSGKILLDGLNVKCGDMCVEIFQEFVLENSTFTSSSDCIGHEYYYNNNNLNFRISNNVFKCVKNVINIRNAENFAARIIGNKIMSGYITMDVINPLSVEISNNEHTSMLTSTFNYLVNLSLRNLYGVNDLTRNGVVKLENNVFKNVSRVSDSSILTLKCSSSGNINYYYKNVIYVNNNMFIGNNVTGVVSTDCSGLASDRNVLNNPNSDYELKILDGIKKEWPAVIYFARNYWGNASNPSFRVLDELVDQTVVKAVIGPWFRDSDMTSLVAQTSTFDKGNSQIGGRMDGNVVLTKDKSPYSVVDDIFVPSDKKLTIEPGVTLNFVYGGITVEGILSANGIENSKIQFTSKGSNFNWKGIKFQKMFQDWLIKKDFNWWAVYINSAWYVVDLLEDSYKKQTADLMCRQAGYKESASQTLFKCNTLSSVEQILVPPCINNSGMYQRATLHCPDSNSFSVQDCDIIFYKSSSSFYNVTCIDRPPMQTEKYVRITAKSGKRLTVTSTDDVILDSQLKSDSDVFLQITPCLLGTVSDCYSLMSLKKPGWKNSNGLVLDPKNNPRRLADFNKDASFVSTPPFNPSDSGHVSIKVLSSSAPADNVVIKVNETSSSLSLSTIFEATSSSSQSAFSFKFEAWEGSTAARKKRATGTAGERSTLNHVRMFNPVLGISIQGQLPLLQNIEIYNSFSHSLQISGYATGNFTIENLLSLDSKGSGLLFKLVDSPSDFQCFITNNTFVNTKEAAIKWTGQGSLVVDSCNFLQFQTYAVSMESSRVESKLSKAIIKSSQFRSKMYTIVLEIYGSSITPYFYVSVENNDFVEVMFKEDYYNHYIMKLSYLNANLENNKFLDCSCTYLIYLVSCYQLRVSGNSIINNSIAYELIFLYSTTSAIITDNIFLNNKGRGRTIRYFNYYHSYTLTINNNSFYSPDLQWDVYIESNWDRLSGVSATVYNLKYNKWMVTDWSSALQRIFCFYNNPNNFPVDIWPSTLVNNGSEKSVDVSIPDPNQYNEFFGGKVGYSRVLSNNSIGFYTILHSIYVPPNVTLTLVGGVVLKFNDGVSLAVEGEIILNQVEVVGVSSFVVLKANKMSLSNVKASNVLGEFKMLVGTENTISSAAVSSDVFTNFNPGTEVLKISNCAFNQVYKMTIAKYNNNYPTNCSVKVSGTNFADTRLSISTSDFAGANIEIIRSSFSDELSLSHYDGAAISLNLYNNDNNILLQENSFESLSSRSIQITRATNFQSKDKIVVQVLDSTFSNSIDSSVVLWNIYGIEAKILRNKFTSNMADTTKNYNMASVSYMYDDYWGAIDQWPSVQSAISQNRFENNGGKCIFEIKTTLSDKEQYYLDLFNRTNSRFDVTSNVFLNNFPSEGVVCSSLPITTFSSNLLSNPLVRYDFVAKYKSGFSQNCTYNWWDSNILANVKARLKDTTVDPTVGRIIFEPFLNESKFSCLAVQSCSGNGMCVAPDVCQCNAGWTGLNCSKYSCSRVYDCLDKGVCVGPNNCSCSPGWSGEDCSWADCRQQNNCSGKGICAGPNQCACASQYSGSDCSQCKTGLCDCTDQNYAGLLCDQCAPKLSGPFCQPLVSLLNISPDSGPDAGETNIFISGNNLPNVATYKCKFDGNLEVPGTWVSENKIACVSPKKSAGVVLLEVKINEIEGYLDSKFYFTYNPSCPVNSCGSNAVPKRGACDMGRCTCFVPWSGDGCDQLGLPPEISPVKNLSLVEGQNFILQLTVDQGSSILRWVLILSPEQANLDENLGLLTWTRVPANTKSYNFKIECSNKYGKSVTSFSISVAPSYSLVIDSLPKGPFLQPQPVTISGKIAWVDSKGNDNFNNSEIPLVLLIKSNYGLRKIPTTASSVPLKSIFSINFQPFNFEVGLTEVDAVHPAMVGNTLTNVQQSWTVYGVNLFLNPASVSGYVDKYQFKNFLTIHNNGLDPLTRLYLLMYTPPMELTLFSTSSQISCKWLPSTNTLIKNCSLAVILRSNESISLNANISADQGLSGSFPITFVTSEGLNKRVIFSYAFQPRNPAFELVPGVIESSVPRGGVLIKQVQVTNVGARSATNVLPQFPSIPNLKFISFGTNATTLTSLSQLGLVLEPGDVQGAVAIVSSETGATFQFRFTIVSTSYLNLTVKVEDEYTYFSDDKPLLAGAKVVLTSEYSDFIATKFTDSTGMVTFVNILEDYYTLQTSADKHIPDSRVIFASQDQDVVSVFVQRNAKTNSIDNDFNILVMNKQENTNCNSWAVKAVSLEDRYDITLEADFTTHVPIPVVTMEPNEIDLDLLETGVLKSLQFKITNHGLISAKGFQITLPSIGDHPFLTLTMNNTDFGDIPANTTFYVVAEVLTDDAKKQQYVGSSLAKRNINKRSIIGCLGISIRATYFYVCDTRRYVSVGVSIHNAVICTWNFFGFGWGWWIGGRFGVVGVSRVSCGCNSNYPELCWTIFSFVSRCISVYYQPNRMSYGYHVMQCVRKVHSLKMCVKLIGGCQSGSGSGGSNGGGLGSGVGSGSGSGGGTGTGSGGETGSGSGGGTGTNVLSKEDLGPVLAKRSLAINEFYVLGITFLGDEAWLYLQEPPTQWWSEIFEPAFSETSEGGSVVTAKEFDVILKSPLPSNATLEMVRKLVLRYNSSFADWDKGGNGSGDGMINLGKVQSSENNLKAYENEAKKANKASISDWYNEAYDIFQRSEYSPEQGVCAKVRIQIQQHVTLTRTGFEAELQLENGESSDLTNIKIVLEITIRGTGNTTNDAIYKFAIGQSKLEGITNASGNGVLLKGKKGIVTWLIIPYSSAAPTSDTQYNVGGTLHYTIGNESLTIPLFPDTITVKPDPRLFIDYFLEKYVYSDDPFTTNVVEPAVPFILGMIITNSGRGTATDLKITSSQPKIIDNEKGLLVDFRIVGTRLAGQDISPSLSIQFGDISPMSAVSVQWIMTCSLSGTFSNFSATFQNTNPLGDSKLSLLEDVKFHELLHTVLIDNPKSDSIVDYLVVDPDITVDVIPNSVYDSSNGTRPLNVSMCSTSSSGLVAFGTTLKLTVTCDKIGWSYLRALFPPTLNAQQTFTSVTNSNGKYLDVRHNVWLQVISKKNYLQIFDYISAPGTHVYTLYTTRSNLHTPTFTPNNFSATILENLTPPQVLIAVNNATDEDNDVITYSLLPQDDLPFSIAPSTAQDIIGDEFLFTIKKGIISSTRQLDREERDQYSIIVLATDSGNPPKSGSAVVFVIVTDANDNPPQISGLSELIIAEDVTPSGAVILGNVLVNDKDALLNAVVTTTLLHPDNQDLLTYDKNDLTIKSTSSFANHVGVHSFSFVVRDSGSPPLTTVANFTLKIVKSNKFKPSFNSTNYTFSVNETNFVGVVIGNVSAWDGDDPNEKITFNMESSVSLNTVPFNVGIDTGLITNLLPLVSTSENTIIKFKVLAFDNGALPTGQFSNSVDVSVKIEDINDHYPMFSKPSYFIEVNESTPINTELILVPAYDLDFGLNSEIKNFSARILSPPNLNFNIYFILDADNTNKKLRIQNAAILAKRSIDTFVIELKVADSGVPSLESTSNLTLSILEVNNCVPSFNSTETNITVFRKIPVNSLLFMFKADDCDLNPQLTYSMVPSQPSVPQNFISLNKNSGSIHLITSLSSNLTIKQLKITVQAFDQLHVSSNNQFLNIFISDVNVLPPVFKPKVYETTVYESLQVGTVLDVVLSCTDDDSLSLFYRIRAGNDDNVFSINVLTGQITLAKSLNFEEKSSYSLTVTAYDDLDQSLALNDSATVQVNVQNVNEFPPAFLDQSGITLKWFSGQLVPNLYKPKDDDNDKVTFTLMPSAESKYFSLDPLAGWLSVIKPVDQPLQTMIQIKATDNDFGLHELNIEILRDFLQKSLDKNINLYSSS